jgi:hypothetical protein
MSQFISVCEYFYVSIRQRICVCECNFIGYQLRP